jgi:ElaB/YqjD/DUF883 family membrane-anchored ribosome-binding protein
METHFPNLNENQSLLARERVLADLRKLADDATSLLNATKDDASEKAREVRGRLAATIEKAKATYDAIEARGLEAARVAATTADDTIRSHPYEAIGIAFAVGLLLGVFLRRK